MSNALHQMTLVYVPEEDRALLRVIMTNATEVQFWLTRKFVNILWDVLIKTVDLLPRKDRSSKVSDDRSIAATRLFEHEEALKKVLDETPNAQNKTSKVIQETPLLVVGINSRIDDTGIANLTLRNKNANEIVLSLSIELLHGFLHQIRTVATQADWNLDLILSQPNASIAIPTEKKHIH